MSMLEHDENRTPYEELQKELRSVKRKLALAESNLTRARLVSATQQRVESILGASVKKELQFFKLVLENATSILLLLDFDGRFAYASRTFLADAGIASFGLISGRHFREVLRPIISEERLSQFADAVDRAVTQKQTVTLEGQIDFNQRGAPRTFSVIITPMTDEEDGKSTGIMALFNDITEINDAMETAKRASLAKSDFLANMSHEIRTPLNAIIGMSAIAQGSEDIDKIQYCLDKINDSSKHLLGVINDILDMSKIEANHFEMSFSSFCFEKMLLRIVDVMRFKIEEKNINFRLRCDPAIPYSIRSDEQRLAQVIMNLLSNAVKFTPENGTVTVCAEVESARNDEYTLRISVKDSGIGISEEQKPRLFKAFSQADSSISRKFGGTGLGLAISKSIVHLLGGDIWFDSASGTGATFAFNMKTRASQQNPPAKAGFHGIRMLAVDGAPDVRDSFATYAEKLDVSCTVAESAEAAMRSLQAQPFDAVFLDWQTLGDGGFDLIRRLCGLCGHAKVALMFSTADWSAIEAEAKRAGVAGFVSKPILLPVIENILDKHCAATAQKSDDAENPDDFSGKKILLADDIEINREIVASLLEYSGISVVDAENGREAVEKFAASPDAFDLIFMDVQMPEMDGYEATRRIRSMKTERAQKIPIVAMTANVFKEDIERCLESGMNDHIGKPVNREEILQKMKQWITA